MNLFLHTEADAEVGMGHLYRCINYWKAAERGGYRATVIVKTESPAITSVLETSGIRFCTISYSDSQEESTWKRLVNPDCTNIIVFDLSNARTNADIDTFDKLVSSASEIFSSTIVLDGMGPDLLATRLTASFDAHLLPYAGAEKIPPHVSGVSYYGAEYFVEPGSYFNYVDCKPVTSLRSVLVSMGGSDPQAYSEAVLNEVLRVEYFDAVKLIVGPAFGFEAKARLQAIARCEPRVSIVVSAEDLMEHIAQADLCIVSSGLTKYEVALLGKPAVLVSFNERMTESNRSFSNMFKIKDFLDVQNGEFSDHLEKMTVDSGIWKTMVERYKEIFDGLGGDRFCKLLGSYC